MKDLKAIRIIEGTKISHDYSGNQVVTFGYRDLVQRKNPAIGIPARQNGLIIVDVDGLSESHKHDGRDWWENFAKEAGMPPTYTVQTPSGGYHFYFKLPVAVNPETFKPPAKLALGVDLKWNGWVAAPPTKGYNILFGTIADIVDAPPSLIAEILKVRDGDEPKNYDPTSPFDEVLKLHRPYTEDQIKELQKRIEWLQSTGELSYDEWRNGLFSLNAGIEDPELLDEMILKWTYNKGYRQGDEAVARDMIERADKHGPIGPGSIFGILKDVALREGAPISASPYTRQEIISKAKVNVKSKPDGAITVAPTESNIAALIGAMFDSSVLYHDTRNDLFIFKNKVYSDVDLTNVIAPMIQSTTHGLGFENIKKNVVAGGIDVLMAARQVDPHKQWLESLEWDGVERINRFFPEYCHTNDDEYTQAVSRNLWLALAARGLEPGCKFDHVVVLEGSEGARKSSLCELLGGEYYMALATKEDINGVDTLRKMHQSTVVELPELIGLIGKSGEEIKAVISARVDNIRALYARKGVKKPRGFVFIGTTNSSRYLSDDMGTRRYLPIKVKGGVCPIKTDEIKRDREQLYAEAVDRFKRGEEFWQVPDQALTEVRQRLNSDPLVDPVRDLLAGNFTGLKMADIYRHLEVGGYVTKGFTVSITKRIESALKSVGAREFMDGIDRKYAVPMKGIEDLL